MIKKFVSPTDTDAEVAREFLRTVLGDRADVILEAEGMPETPARMLKALVELTGGYDTDIAGIMGKTFPSPSGEHSGVVVVRGIPFASLCEHHVLPFVGTVSVGYLPGDRIVGLSKIPRMIRALSRRLQVQERLTNQIAASFAPLNPRAVAVVVKGQHSCCALRGIEASAEMVTSRYTGAWDENREGMTPESLQLVALQRAEITRLLGI